MYCISCESPKNYTIPKRALGSKKLEGVDLSTPGVSFSFGVSSLISSTPANLSLTFSSVEQPKTVESSKLTPNSVANFTPTNFTPSLDIKEGGDCNKFVFGSSNKITFEFTPKSPRHHNASVGEESDSYVEEEEEEDQIYFKPVVPLPDKVEVVTGEEAEDVLFCHRAKLFKFVQSEWKERGLGDIKILKNNVTGKIRYL